MSRFLTAVAAVFAAAVLIFSPAVAYGQENATPSAAVLQKERLDAEIEELSTIYRGQLNEYRLAEREFQIAKDQYRQLQTLASINQVTEAARKVMRIRNQVLITYFELLRIRLIAAEGIDVAVKSAAIAKLTAQNEWLQAHQQQVAAATDREHFNTLSDIFIAQEPLFVTTSQEASSILSVGKLQTVLDRLTLLAQDVAPLEASNSSAASSRSLRETNNTITELNASFQTTWQNLEEDIREDRIVSFYTNLTETLNPLYSSLNRLASFLGELLQEL